MHRISTGQVVGVTIPRAQLFAEAEDFGYPLSDADVSQIDGTWLVRGEPYREWLAERANDFLRSRGLL